MTPHGSDAPRLVVGLQPVREAIRVHGEQLERVLVSNARGAARERLDAVARFARDSKVRHVEAVALAELDRLSGGVTHQGVAAFAPPLRFTSPLELLAAPALLGIVLDGIEDPQNFGAVVRSAVGVADASVVWGLSSSAPLSLSTFRASAGAIEHATLCPVRSLPDVLRQATAAGVRVVGLDAQAAQPLTEIDLTGPSLIVLGGEHRGLRKAVRKACSCWASVVRPRTIDSLNASVAAAIALYEASKQRVTSGG